jgi:hypothetical protein
VRGDRQMAGYEFYMDEEINEQITAMLREEE